MKLNTRTMKFAKLLILLASAVAFMGCPNSGNQEPSSSCVNEDNLALEESCFAATVIEQGNPFPNPLQSGGTANLKMKIGAVDNNFNPIPASISTKVFSSTSGQLITQQNVGTVPPSSSFQNVPIWTNINVAAGSYYVEVTIDVGACGKKTICLSDKRITVIK